MKGVFTFIDCTEYLISGDCWGVAGAQSLWQLQKKENWAGMKLGDNKRYKDMAFE